MTRLGSRSASDSQGCRGGAASASLAVDSCGIRPLMRELSVTAACRRERRHCATPHERPVDRRTRATPDWQSDAHVRHRESAQAPHSTHQRTTSASSHSQAARPTCSPPVPTTMPIRLATPARELPATAPRQTQPRYPHARMARDLAASETVFSVAYGFSPRSLLIFVIAVCWCESR